MESFVDPTKKKKSLNFGSIIFKIITIEGGTYQGQVSPIVCKFFSVLSMTVIINKYLNM